MAQSLKTRTARRALALTITAMIALAILAAIASRALSLRDTTHASGWLLLILIVFLAAYNLRKKLTYPPMLSASVWLHLHVYIGLLCIVIFLAHTGVRVPTGVLEGSLSILFSTVAVSGIIGLALSRAVPPRLADRGEEVLFERIPTHRRQLRERAEAIIFRWIEHDDSATLSDFYQSRLADFFTRPMHTWHHLFQSSRPRRRLLNELHELNRYLDREGREASQELSELICVKDDLDYHRIMQGMLKGWLFVHLPLTYVMLLIAVLHIVLAMAFSGSAL